MFLFRWTIIFPVDFIVMDIEKDKEVPLILDKPFMKTASIIDVDERKLKVRAQDGEVTSNVYDGLKHSNVGKDCLKTNAAKEAFPETKEQLNLSNILEKVIHHCTSQAFETQEIVCTRLCGKATHK